MLEKFKPDRYIKKEIFIPFYAKINYRSKKSEKYILIGYDGKTIKVLSNEKSIISLGRNITKKLKENGGGFANFSKPHKVSPIDKASCERFLKKKGFGEEERNLIKMSL